MIKKSIVALLTAVMTLPGALFVSPPQTAAETMADYSLLPPFVSAGVPPLVMLVLGRDHKLYYEAYNDISDLNGDGILDVGYNPAIDYYGYFDSYKQYVYNSSQNRFDPVAVAPDKKVTTTGRWSGDFLNYLTTTRMDALRKVLYGGHRSTDSATETVLQRVYVPQDAHSWGKEYESAARDGFDIRQYTPLGLPAANTRHMFASTTLSDNGNPLLRVLPNNPGRIWEWVAKERPVADSSMETSGFYNGHPNNHSEFTNLIMQYGIPANRLGSRSISNINGSGNPFTSQQDYFLTIFAGQLVVDRAGTYRFAVDGDDAVEVIINGQVVAGWYGGHGSCGCQNYEGSISLSSGTHTIEFRHEENTGGDSYRLYWRGNDTGGSWQTVPAKGSNRFGLQNLTQTTYSLSNPSSTITDYQVRVKVCDPTMPEANCKIYPSGAYKPVGLLQRHGEANGMYFGLISGSYTKNTSGGVLRKNIGSITDEINLTTGQLSSTNGIIQTINKLRTDGFSYGNYSYNENCGWITTRAINEGECRMWGNPVGEMMYEGVRYFAGKKSATSAYTYGTDSSFDDNQLGLPKPAWQDPYATYPGCSKPFMLVLSDINPSFDSDQLPGSLFNSFSGDLSGLNVSSLADLISISEGIDGKSYYIGQSGITGNSYDGAPTAKLVSSLSEVRGLSPEEPTKQGSYYSASVAYYGRKTDVNPAAGDQKVITYGVALASPLPRIEIPVAGKTITLVPFAKSVGGSSINAAKGQFQPTNSIVDVFIEQITPTYGKFRINFEDVEQGADHDMDAIVQYEYRVNADNTVTISLDSSYAAGGIIQHMGYVISGTTADGTYLEVRDYDTSAGSDPDYYLDTPPGQAPFPKGKWNDNQPLPLQTSRTFTPGTSTAATLLKNPLWYAAKWGGFEDMNGDLLPDLDQEWNSDQDTLGDPDTYFYVTNPLKLEEQLEKSFADILRRSSSGTAASVVSSSRSGEGAVYQSVFYPEYSDQHGNIVNWIGDTRALFVDSQGNMREDTDGDGKLDFAKDLVIRFVGDQIEKYSDADGDGKLDPAKSAETTPVSLGTVKDIKFLWSAANWLNSLADADVLAQRPYTSTQNRRHIFTLVDADRDMVADPGEQRDFLETQTAILPFIHGLSPFDVSQVPAYLSSAMSIPSTAFSNFLTTQRQRVIRYIRGQDQGSFTNASPAYTIPGFRNRKINFENTGVKTWRLGDVVDSSPTLVAQPQEDYDLLYRDKSYTDFFLKYRNRRNVVYVGANDGMLHAFNGGFYDKTQKKFWRGYDPNSTAKFSDNGLPLGAELWGYVPYNLLPHLYWLTDPGYNSNYHVAYVDLKPRVFDARIFFKADGITPLDADHPNGWGTVMVVGMRFGGGALKPDTNGDNSKTNEPTLSSAYIVMDITNPETPPRVLAELAMPDMGFSTVYPWVIPMADRGDVLSPATPNNEWYLVLGSGPVGSSGAFGTALSDGSSTKSAKLYVVDLKKLASNAELHSLNSSGALTAGAQIFASLDSNAFVSDPVSVDYEFDYKADAVYFGTVSGNYTAGWGGKLRRIVVDSNMDTTKWVGDSTLIDLGSVYDGQPVVAAPIVAMSQKKDRWVYFGTGRFFNRNDINNVNTSTDKQSYYGVKEPYSLLSGVKTWTWGSVARANLLDVTGVEVYHGGGTVLDPTGRAGFPGNKTNFNDLEEMMDAPVGDAKFKPGWVRDLTALGERNLGQAALMGDILTFSSYLPSSDLCEIEGFSSLYALYFKTGTGYKRPVIGLGSKTVNEDTDGDGQADTVQNEVKIQGDPSAGLILTPSLHMGTNVFVQSSTGAIEKIEQTSPGKIKSGTASWKEE